MLRHPLFIKFAARFIQAILSLLFRTCKVNVRGLENLDSPHKLILMFWHNRVAIAPQILHAFTPHKNYTAVVSASRDGLYLSAMIEKYGHGTTIKVPHDNRPAALKKVIAQLKETTSIVIITPDGPRGPRYQVKGGVVLAAKGADAQVVPMSWSAKRYWEFKTWDRMMLPKPFTTIDVTFGKPISLEDGPASSHQKRLEEALTFSP